MKSLKTKTYFLQTFLTAMATTMAVLATLFANDNITFTRGSWGFIDAGGTQVPFFFGVISVFHCLGFLSFVFIYLSFELYGLKSAIYTTLTTLLVMSSVYALMLGIQHLNTNSPDLFFDSRHITFQILSHRDFVINVLPLAAGIVITVLFAALLQKMTRDYFMFFRYTLAAVIGFVALVFLEFTLKSGQFHLDEIELATALTPVAQYLALIIGFIVPLYIFRLFLGPFRGRTATAVAIAAAPAPETTTTAKSVVAKDPKPDSHYAPQATSSIELEPTKERDIKL